MTDGWNSAARSRLDFADLLEDLSAEQLDTDSLCAGWRMRDVAGHIVSFIEMSLPTMVSSLAKGGFNVHKAWDANAKKYGAREPAQIVAALRANPAHPSAMKFLPAGVTTVDVSVHTQDIRRPLGLTDPLDPTVLRDALEFCTTHKQRKLIVPPKDIDGLRLEATDMDWSWGDGELVRGPAEAILMGINRREVGDELTGDGVPELPAG